MKRYACLPRLLLPAQSYHRISLLHSGVGQNIASRASSTAHDSCFCLKVLSTSFCPTLLLQDVARVGNTDQTVTGGLMNSGSSFYEFGSWLGVSYQN